MAHVEFFYDLSSPWTYLAFHNIQPILKETGATVRWRPFLVGGVFNAVNSGVYANRLDPDNRKQRHAVKSLHDWARLVNLPLNFSAYHPLKSVNPMRFCCAIEDDQEALVQFSSKAFHAYFGEMQNLDEISVLVDVANACGLNGSDLALESQVDRIKQRLRANTEEAIERGAYGSPTMFVNSTDMYFGNDQLPLVQRALSR